MLGSYHVNNHRPSDGPVTHPGARGRANNAIATERRAQYIIDEYNNLNGKKDINFLRKR